MKKLVLFLLVSLFICGVYFSTNSTSALAGDDEPASNWITDEPTPEPEPFEMDVPDDYDQQNEEDDESDESDDEGAPDAD